jgi:hypothetical protein
MPRKGSATTWPRHLDEAASGGKRLKLTTRADSNYAVRRACGLVQVLQHRPEEAGLDVVPGGLFYGPAHIRVGDTATRLGGADQPTPVSVVVWPGGFCQPGRAREACLGDIGARRISSSCLADRWG